MKRFLIGLALLCGIAPALAVDPSTSVGNANYTALSTDIRLVPTVALTANRTWTLPFAGATCIGQLCPASAMEITDSQGNVGGANSCIIIAPASGDTINGSTSSITFCSTYGRVVLFPMTGTNWFAQILGPGQFAATTTSDNAQAGFIGEFVSASVISGATVATSTAPALNTTVPATVAQVLLTAGDWDCRGNARALLGPTTSMTLFSAWTSATSSGSYVNASNVTDSGALASWVGDTSIYVPANGLALALTPVRYSLAASTSIYLGAVANFTTAALSASGFLGCRRVR